MRAVQGFRDVCWQEGCLWDRARAHKGEECPSGPSLAGSQRMWVAWKEARMPCLDQEWAEVIECALSRHLCCVSPGVPETWAGGTESGEEGGAAHPKPGPDRWWHPGGNPPPHIPRSPDALAGVGMTERSLAFPPLQRLVGPGVPGPPGVRAAAPSRGRALRRMPQPPGSSHLHHE